MRQHNLMQLLGSGILAIGLVGCGSGDKKAEESGTTTTATATAADSVPATPAPAAAAPGDAVPADTSATAAAAPGAAVTAGVTYASLTGDATHGEQVFGQCKVCHVAEKGVNRVGPSLWGVVGRPSGSIPNYQYSAANKNSGLTWSEDQLFSYLEAPQKVVPGTKMAFAGLKKPQDRADVIAYLKTRA